MPEANGGEYSFDPHPLLRNAHVQTIVGRYLGGGDAFLEAISHEVMLDDGDRLSVLESIPENWAPGQPAALLVHGLAGSAQSSYMVRLAKRLLGDGIRVVRLNLRGAGMGRGLSKGVYHAGRTDDVRKVLGWLSARSPHTPIALVGFSLGGNLTLKLAAEAAEHPVPGLDCVIAANPPIDLAACARQIRRPQNWIYDWNFVRWLRREVDHLHRILPELGPAGLEQVKSLYDFDDQYTAPRNGFRSAEDYYSRCSAGPLIPRIKLPGLVVHAADDPFVPIESFLSTNFPPNLTLNVTLRGGHLGYLSRSRRQGDHRWLDTRLAGWLASRWDANGIGGETSINDGAPDRDA